MTDTEQIEATQLNPGDTSEFYYLVGVLVDREVELELFDLLECLEIGGGE